VPLVERQQLRLHQLAFRLDLPLLLQLQVAEVVLEAQEALDHQHPLQAALEHRHPQAVVCLDQRLHRVPEEGSLALPHQPVVDCLVVVVVVAALDRQHQLHRLDSLEHLLQLVEGCLELQLLLEEDSLALLRQLVVDCLVLLPPLVVVCMEPLPHNMVSNSSNRCNNNPHKQPYRRTWTLRRARNKNASPKPCKS
jgi:hypothetical protein